MLYTILIGAMILIAAVVFGMGFFVIAKIGIAKYEEAERLRLSKLIEREHAARQVRMARHSMTQFAGTKASHRHW